MSDLAKYLNDPDIVNEPMPLREVHAIRLLLHDERKGLSTEERTARIREETDETMKKYGLTHLLVPSVKK